MPITKTTAPKFKILISKLTDPNYGKTTNQNHMYFLNQVLFIQHFITFLNRNRTRKNKPDEHPQQNVTRT
jgi:hypothetical protein